MKSFLYPTSEVSSKLSATVRRRLLHLISPAAPRAVRSQPPKHESMGPHTATLSATPKDGFIQN